MSLFRAGAAGQYSRAAPEQEAAVGSNGLGISANPLLSLFRHIRVFIFATGPYRRRRATPHKTMGRSR